MDAAPLVVGSCRDFWLDTSTHDTLYSPTLSRFMIARPRRNRISVSVPREYGSYSFRVILVPLGVDKARLSLHPKSDCVDKVIEVVRRKNAVQWVGFKDGSLAKMKRVKELEPSITVFWDRMKSNIAEVIKIVKYKLEWMVLNKNHITNDDVKLLRATGIKVGVWTVNKPNEMKKFLDMGVDRLYTDNPLAMKRINSLLFTFLRGQALRTGGPQKLAQAELSWECHVT